MSVYTTVYKQDIEQLLKRYTIGTLIDFSGVEDGIENTTYFIKTEKEKEVNEWVLTIFEHECEQVLTQYVQLLSYLSQSIPVPPPLCDSGGKSVQVIHNKPAVLVPKVEGDHLIKPLPSHCVQIGATLAKLHTETTGYSHPIPSACDFSWIEKETRSWMHKLNEEDQKIMKSALQLCRFMLPKYSTLPKAIIHSDLFIDNALFYKGNLSGVIDFFSAGTDFMLMDVAVAINDWCVDYNGIIDQVRYEALLEGYQSIRPLQPLEHIALPFFLHLAALRYWTLRLKVQLKNLEQNRSGDLIKFKDPTWFKDIVQARQKAIM